MTPITFNTWTAQTRTCNDEVANRLISQFNIMLEGQLFRDNQTPLGIHWCLGPELQTARNLGLFGRFSSARTRDFGGQKLAIWNRDLGVFVAGLGVR